MFPMKRKAVDESSDCSTRAHSCRFKVPAACVVGGTWKSFSEFYQNGGRDYDQYRLWLNQPSAKSPSEPRPPILKLAEIKAEPFDIPSNVVTILPPPLPLAPIPAPLPSAAPSSSRTIRRLQPASRPRPVAPRSPVAATRRSPHVKTVREMNSSPPNDQFYVQLAVSSPPPMPVSVTLLSWSINDVSQFLQKNFEDKNLTRRFIEQGIDGRALSLLTEDHLTRVFKMKLGPALRLLTVIASMCQQAPSHKHSCLSTSTSLNKTSANISV